MLDLYSEHRSFRPQISHLGLRAVQAVWYRQSAFEHKQAALRPDFVQVAEPMELLA